MLDERSDLVDVAIIATRGCSHRASLEHELRTPGVEYELLFTEDNPALVGKLDIHHSPNLLVNGRIVCRSLPTTSELKALLALD